jgi:hypothetical protein
MHLLVIVDGAVVLETADRAAAEAVALDLTALGSKAIIAQVVEPEDA